MISLRGQGSVWLGLLTSVLLATPSASAGGAGVGVSGVGSGGIGSAAVGGTGAGQSGGRGGVSIGASGGRSTGATGGSSLGRGRSLGNPGIGRGNPGSFNSSQGGGARSLGTYNGARPSVATNNPSSQAHGTLGGNRPAVSAPAQTIARPNNLWSDRGTGTGLAARHNAQVNPQGLQNGAYPYDRGVNGGSYTRLYPGSYGYGLRNYNDVRNKGNDHGRGRSGNYHDDNGRHHHHGARSYYPYYLGGSYYPFVGGYGYYGGLGVENGYLNNDVSLTPDLSTYDGGSQPVPQARLDEPNGYDVPPMDSTIQPPPAAKSATPWADHQEPAKPSPIGPDSMVEAVQDELARRGYFKGKVDAMFRPDTKDAIRQFQTESNLQPTGLLNSATLTMLGLN